MKNIIIFGASKFGEKVFNYFQDKPDLNIIGFCDNDVKKNIKQPYLINLFIRHWL